MNRRTCIGLAFALVGSAAMAQTYPTKPIKLLVPFAPGGTTDIIARVMAEPLGRELGQTVIVENKGGGGGVIGALDTSRAAPDGYSLGIATVSTTATNPAINPKIPYNTLTDFTPVINIAATPNVLAVNPKFGPTNHKDFLATLKASQGKFSYASSGTGGIQHMLMELYKSLTGTFITHIPYRGAGPALNDTVAGQVPMILDNLPSALPFIKDKRLLPIAVAAPSRLAVLPDVPTYKEVGHPELNDPSWFGLVAPKSTPAETVARVQKAVAEALKDPAVKKRMDAQGMYISGTSSADFTKQIASEVAKMKSVAASANISVN